MPCQTFLYNARKCWCKHLVPMTNDSVVTPISSQSILDKYTKSGESASQKIVNLFNTCKRVKPFPYTQFHPKDTTGQTKWEHPLHIFRTHSFTIKIQLAKQNENTPYIFSVHTVLHQRYSWSNKETTPLTLFSKLSRKEIENRHLIGNYIFL